MSRTTTAAQDAEIAKDALDPFLLAELDFSGGFVRIWTGGGDLLWDGKTWKGIGTMGQIGGIDETLEVRASGAVLRLNGFDSALLAIALGEQYQGRPARVWLGTFDTSYQVVVDPTLFFAGRMDVMEDTDDGQTASIALTVENHLVDLGRPRAWRYTDQDQQRLYPADLGFEFVAGLEDKKIVWG